MRPDVHAVGRAEAANRRSRAEAIHGAERRKQCTLRLEADHFGQYGGLVAPHAVQLAQMADRTPRERGDD
jgi:hypothetical protein